MTVPSARLGDLREFDESMGVGDAVKGRKEETLAHVRSRFLTERASELSRAD